MIAFLGSNIASAQTTYCSTSFCFPTFFTAVEPITNVTFAGINNTTSNTVNGTAQFEPFCIAGNVIAGNTYPISVKGNTVDVVYQWWTATFTDYFTVFIDYNRNGVYEQSERTDIGTITSSTGIDNKVLTSSISIPSTATVGATRMRVIKNLYFYVWDPCGSYANGQAEDYTININNDCTPATGATANGTATSLSVCSGSSITLKQTGGVLGAGASWKWYKGGCGQTPVNTNTNADGAYTLPAVTGVTDYYVRAEGGACGTTGTCKKVTVIATGTLAGIFASPIVSTCYNGSGVLTLTGTIGLIQKWQSSTDKINWTNINNTTSLLNFTNVQQTTYYRAIATNLSGCLADTSAAVKVTLRNLWTGAVSTDWNNVTNWSDETLPNLNTCDDIVIQSTANGRYPALAEGINSMKNIRIHPNAALTVGAGVVLQVSGTIINNGTLDVTAGTLELTGTTAQTISGSAFKNRIINNLKLSNNAGVSLSATLNDTLNITGLLSFGKSNVALHTNDNLTIKSTVTATGAIADLTNGGVNTGNSINGKVIVERYINTGTAAGQHGKSWQFVSASTAGATIKASWMENGVVAANRYGAWITDATGTANGFDATSASPSMKVYVPATDSYTGVTNPNTTNLKNDAGYMLYIRGDRTVTGNITPVPTVLRSKGTLVTGTQAPVAVTANKFRSVGNPYASAVDFSKLTITGGVETNKFYVWDPTLGTAGTGGYQTIRKIGSTYYATPGGFNANALYNTTNDYRNIQSGQAFFVHATGTAGTVTFNETSKATGSRLANRKNDDAAGIFRTSLIGNDGIMADGNILIFEDSATNEIDADDANKVMNSGENFGLLRDGKLLSAEARKTISVADTLFYKMQNMRQLPYQLVFTPENMMEPGLQAVLVDNFLNTRTTISMTDTTTIPVTISAVAGSYAADRFMVVFTKLISTLPVHITSISAVRNADRTITVSWKAEDELNMVKYEVERSADGVSFKSIVSALPVATNGGNAVYNRIDLSPLATDNYYRIKAISLNGMVQYSAIVKVAAAKTIASIGVYPNPVEGKNANLGFTNQDKGTYKVKIFNQAGQAIYTGSITVTSSNFITTLGLPTSTAAGSYQLQVVSENGTVTTQQVMVL